ncbi:citrate/2-methylcitrate synthase [Halobacillus salinus]|uniref:Citrate synthase n=1 Tax=Halobacillus salinus TaxID=192814 RepID=A0A4Z0H605_9BACI|nr:citrate/2-methylcitrate synthase [Halobacillus salinus]TGB04626.1 citrate synthase/methylcitrate synthase [Halobacillus salinus]
MEVSRGLKGVTAVKTSISDIDGEEGALQYRTTGLAECMKHSFEKVSHYIWENEWREQKISFEENRFLSNSVKTMIQTLAADQSLIATIRSAVSMVDISVDEWPVSRKTAERLTAVMPSIVACAYRAKQDKLFVEPRTDLGHVENFLYMINGQMPSEEQTAALESYMIATMEHGLNASTFTSRVVISTQSDAYSAAAAAIGALKGPLHGGAPTGVMAYLDKVNKSSVATVIDEKLQNGEKIMGFGHRVYNTTDPRATALKEQLLQISPRPAWVDRAVMIEEETVEHLNQRKPGRKLYANVEFYAAALMKAIGIPAELFTPIFCCSRMVGWTAHMMEQSRNNVIFRPNAKYVGDQ